MRNASVMRPSSARPMRRARGVTFIELMVVIGLIALFSVALVGAFKRFQSGFQASSALTRVESALHYARNLAIANNCVYHVRFENVVTDSAQGTVGSPLGVPQVPPLPPQSLAIYCFPDIGTALTVTSEESQIQGQPIKWNTRNTINNGSAGVWAATAPYKSGDSVIYNNLYYLCILATVPSTTTPDADVAHFTQTAPFYNFLVERIDLPQDTYFGVQYQDAANASDASFQPLLYFKPDGSQTYSGETGLYAGTLTLFVTDSKILAEDRNTGSRQSQSDTRKTLYNTHKMPLGLGAKALPWLRLIHVYKGGMIKVRPLLTASGGPNPL